MKKHFPYRTSRLAWLLFLGLFPFLSACAQLQIDFGPESALRKLQMADAANINAVFAYRFLGQCYEFGLGTETNIDKAIFWYEKDTKSGLHHPDVITHLKELKSK